MFKNLFPRVTLTSKSNFLDFKLFLKCIILRKSYSEYYGLRQDRIVLSNPNWGLNLEKKFQLNYLIQKGLKPEHKFLDYGCGAGSAGRYFIKYLNKENYIGVDVSSEAIKQANLRMMKFGLVKKNPIFNLIDFSDLNCLNYCKFDYIWTQSVLTHMSPRDINLLVPKLKRVLRENGQFFCTFCLSERITHVNFKDWAYPLSFFEEICKKNHLSMDLQNDWVHPDDPNGTDKMLIIKSVV